MVDADAVVLLPRPGLVVPERVETGLRVTGAHRVDKTRADELAEGRARLGLKQGVAGPGCGALSVVRAGDNIEIAGEHERLLAHEERACVPIEPRHPD